MSEREEFENFVKTGDYDYSSFPWRCWKVSAELKDKEIAAILQDHKSVVYGIGQELEQLRAERERNLESIRQGNDIIARQRVELAEKQDSINLMMSGAHHLIAENKDFRAELDSAVAQLSSYKDILVEASAAIDELDVLKMQKPVAWVNADNRDGKCYTFNGLEILQDGKHHLYARPVPEIPEGMALVPVEPTPNMKSRALDVETEDYCLSWEEITDIYKAMIAAAQKGGE